MYKRQIYTTSAKKRVVCCIYDCLHICYFCYVTFYRFNQIHFSYLPINYITSAPNGIRDNFAILKNCFPKGIPIIVIQHIRPATAFPTAIGIPDTISQIIFAIKLTAPPPYTTSFPNGKNAKPANLKHCKPIGIPIIEMHHRQPAKTHDNPLNNPPHINQSIFPNMLDVYKRQISY